MEDAVSWRWGKGCEGEVKLLTLSSAKEEDFIVSGSYCKGICCLDKDKLASSREKANKNNLFS